jgi:hypothetical protein
MEVRRWVTFLKALDPETLELKTWAGPTVPGISLDDAQAWCELNGFGYLKVTGELVAEIDEQGREIDYESLRAN